jgi:hypothetical protein
LHTACGEGVAPPFSEGNVLTGRVVGPMQREGGAACELSCSLGLQ